MTAVVGILNKYAVAIAADSAVTINGPSGKKIFNRANKIFTLSKHHPVCVMIHNSPSFMGTPWETIIKVYRKHLGKNSFPTLKEYQADFIEFVRGKNFYATQEAKDFSLFAFSTTTINTIINEVCGQNGHLLLEVTDANKQMLLNLIEERIDYYAGVWGGTGQKICPELVDLVETGFTTAINPVFDEIINAVFTNSGYNPSPQLVNKIKHALFLFFRIHETLTNFTGLIFVGFGEDEIYPSLIPVNVFQAIDNRLRYYIDDNASSTINDNYSGSIRPFAQTDVIDTILAGIDDGLDKIYLENFRASFEKYNNFLLGLIADSNPPLSGQIRALDLSVLVDEFNKKNLETRSTKYIVPLINAVSNLSKEDLAEMAESLIYLTYLKRRITFAEESVGGPVDVAVISKGDGFVWIKRKLYFKSDLNQHFFDNYLNE